MMIIDPNCLSPKVTTTQTGKNGRVTVKRKKGLWSITEAFHYFNQRLEGGEYENETN